LAAEVEASRAAWAGSGAVMAPMLGNHDVPRLISDLAGAPLDRPRDLPPAAPERDRPYALQALAWTFLLSQPGAPVIYYGDEIGMPGAGDPDNRRAMRFAAALSDRERGLLHHVRRLGRARRCSRALRRGGYQTLFAIANLYAYGRPSADGRPALVVLNPTTGRRAVDLAIPPDWPLAEGAVFADLFGAPVSRDGRHLQLTVPALSAALLLSEPACIGGSR
jgi:glycosidase